MSYNGWSNYETWNVALWIDNDQGIYNYVEEMKESATNAEELSERIEVFVTEEVIPELEGLAADLMNSALSEVDWLEIAHTKMEYTGD